MFASFEPVAAVEKAGVVDGAAIERMLLDADVMLTSTKLLREETETRRRRYEIAAVSLDDEEQGAYGEFPLLGMALLLTHPAVKGKNFVDIGSGVGRLLMAAAAMDGRWKSGSLSPFSRRRRQSPNTLPPPIPCLRRRPGHSCAALPLPSPTHHRHSHHSSLPSPPPPSPPPPPPLPPPCSRGDRVQRGAA